MDKATPHIKAIIGLGNPSLEYRNTYHNVGSMVLVDIAGTQKFEVPGKKYFEYVKSVGGLILIRPLLFMNETGIYPEEPIKDQERDHIILVFLAKETKFPPKTLTQVDLKQEFYFPPHTSGSLNINEEAASSGVCIFCYKCQNYVKFTINICSYC